MIQTAFLNHTDSVDGVSDFNRFFESEPPLKIFREKVVCAAEIQYLKRLMAVCARNAKKASKISGLSLTRLYSLLRKYGIPLKQV